MPQPLTPEQLARDLAVPDLTDPEQGRHAVQLLVDEAAAALAARWACPVRRVRGPRVVPLADNYDALRIDTDAVTREARYTRYVDDTNVLRSHSTAMIPGALRALAGDPVDDVVLACAGVVYRRDAIDRLHTGTPNQLDLWRISRARRTETDLEEMIAVLVGALAPVRRYRTEPREHPYTLAGRQVDVDWDGEWVEVWECGLAHPEVLAGAGLAGWHGLALGMGLDRLVMLRKGVPDIRLLRSRDPRIAVQMLDLEPYRAVSSMPPVRRDLSIAVDQHDTDEDLGDRVRDSLGDDAGAVEEVAVLSQTAYDELPPKAVERLGMRRHQKNVLVRVVLRPVDRTLTDAEANGLRDRVYAALHQGTAHQWASAETKPES